MFLLYIYKLLTELIGFFLTSSKLSLVAGAWRLEKSDGLAHTIYSNLCLHYLQNVWIQMLLALEGYMARIKADLLRSHRWICCRWDSLPNLVDCCQPWPQSWLLCFWLNQNGERERNSFVKNDNNNTYKLIKEGCTKN